MDPARDFSALPAPPLEYVEYRGSVGGRITKATYPLGRLRATRGLLRIWFTGGELWPSISVLRAEVDAIEYRRGVLGGAMGSSVWVVLADGQRLTTRFICMPIGSVTQDLIRLGWPVRERGSSKPAE